jgi:signal transduction histidine kinase
MDEKEEFERERRLERVFEYVTYSTCLVVFISLFLSAFGQADKLAISLICLTASIGAFFNYRILPPSHKGFISWDFETKSFLIGVLDYLFVTLAMVFSGGIKSPYFFVYFLPLLAGSLILRPIHMIGEVIVIYLGYLMVRFFTFGFWPLFDQNFFLAFSSVGLVAVLVARTGLEERIARQKAQSLANQLKEANIKLQELDKMKDEFLSVASHELRTPMAAIKGFISLILQGGGGRIEPKVKEYLLQAYQGNERLIKLINDLLSVSRIESGRIEYSSMEFDPQEVVEEVVKELGPEARNKKLFLRHKRFPFKVYVKADPEKLREVVFNLLGNGIKFTEHGGVEVSYYVSDDQLTVKVADTGEGIAKENQGLLFRKFQQLGPLLKRHPGGTGLGLYITKQYLQGMEGKIWLEESNVGKGSTFSFRLPCRVSEDLSKFGEPAKMGEKEKRFFFVNQKSH